ncbi:hypothetical protein GCM10022237_02680 [Nocardioides ginsengisoli]|uniref:M15 family metallopeptidase n=1 Tax=Nocardioides ginsengisoli TaxID=363868 RepID=A0ABW3W4K1_9ACTN
MKPRIRILLVVAVAAAGIAAVVLDLPPSLEARAKPTRDDAGVAPALMAAYRAAARDAGSDGVRLRITSGRRTRAEQQRLLDEAIEKYGSRAEAARWVASPDTSAHVRGDALDIGPTDGALWLDEHGAAYGLCQVYANEIWHFELLTTPGGTCPALLPDGSSAR